MTLSEATRSILAGTVRGLDDQLERDRAAEQDLAKRLGEIRTRMAEAATQRAQLVADLEVDPAEADVLRAPAEWERVLGLRVVDPDGWTGADAKPWEEPVTREEFERRAAESTVDGRGKPAKS